MVINGNVLLVEDERSWSEIYERAVRRVGLDKVKVTETFAEAEDAIDAIRFAVALVDIGLHVDDDTNVDGLRVMEKIRAVGDKTSIIVITGRSGRDVLPIVRDAIKKYDAHDTIAKSTLLPAELRKLVESGLRAYEVGSSDDRGSLFAALRGDIQPQIWDDMIMRGAATGGGAAGLYRLIETLFGPFVPLVAGEPRGVRIKDGLACGIFWSRGIGDAIVTCFGASNRMEVAMETVRNGGLLLDAYSVGQLVGEYSAASTQGVIYTLADHVRANFGSVHE
jgi:CheY-like chemotaxis protein